MIRIPENPSESTGIPWTTIGIHRNSIENHTNTTGIQGNPKGVMIEHTNVRNFFKGLDSKINNTAAATNVWLAVTSINFDISVLELLWTITKGDKIINDFRISTVGSFFRKYWIDELPMLINLFKGEIKIVGVRPLSKHKFSLYPKDVQDLRSKFKPGLIPPFYADNPNSFDELVKSEVNYLKQFSINPILTDVRYFFLSLKNIIFKGARSK